MKIGSTNVSSFRLGDTTPSKVYIGSTEVWSDVVATVPDALSIVNADTSSTEQSAADISWATPANGGSAITGYNIYLSTDGGTTFNLLTNVANSPYEYIEPYRGAEQRVFDVRAVNAIGEAATAAMYGTATLSNSPPAAPTGLTVTNLSGYDLYADFEASLHSGGYPVNDFEIGYTIPTYSETIESTGSQDSYTIDLTSTVEGQNIDIRVRAISNDGTSDLYGEWSAVVASPPVGDVPDAVGSFGASTASPQQGAVSLSILTPDGNGIPVDSYDIEHDIDASFSSPVFDGTFTDQTAGYFNKVIEGLLGGVLYYFRVRFTNAAGNAEWTNFNVSATSSSTPPNQVTGFTVDPNYTNTEWNTDWTEPVSGGSMITGYEIQESATNDFASATSVYPSSGSTSYDYSVGTADANRYFRIRASNAVGNGVWSAPVLAYYDTPTVPGAPTITTAQYDDDTLQTYIAYNPPVDDGNSAITAYTFYFNGTAQSPSSTGANDAVFNADYSGQDATMTATNSVGEGGSSNTVTVATV